MTDDITIIEGSIKFREGKKWKSRWCALRKLSPVADCVQLEVHPVVPGVGGAGGARAAGPARSVVSLQHFVGYESGLALGEERHVVAVLVADGAPGPALVGDRASVPVLLAAADRESMRRWTDALRQIAGEPARFEVRAEGVPARLLVVRGRLSLVGGAGGAGAIPRVLGSWPLRHVRRYGALRDRFAFEAGSRCGPGAGLRVLVADRAHHIARAVSLAAGTATPAPAAAGLERCASCVSRLDAAGFSPAWTMDRHYDAPKNFEVDGEYYDRPRRINEHHDEEFRIPKSRTADALVRRVDDWLQPGGGARGGPAALYATVDARRKLRAASTSRAAPALPAPHYENVPRECDYLTMCYTSRARPGDYAEMLPVTTVPRAASIPTLEDDSGVWSPRPPTHAATVVGTDSHSTSSGASSGASSGTSDMSDYMETLSLSSDRSWETPRPLIP